MVSRGISSPTGASERTAVVTVDVHSTDTAMDIEAASEHLGSLGIRATFFVPGELLATPNGLASALRSLTGAHHEVGSHGFHHDAQEIEALTHGKERDLTFLATARSAFEDFYGYRPVAFRAPAWCRLGEPALDALARLGYQVDSSATPQRLPALSSRPFSRGWMLSRRAPHFLRPELLEVPTATALVPAGSITFRLMRRRVSRLFVNLLLVEAAQDPRRVFVLQFDSRDLNPRAAREYRKPLAAADFLPKRETGFGFRRHLLEYDPAAIARTAESVLRMLPPTHTLSEVRRAVASARGVA